MNRIFFALIFFIFATGFSSYTVIEDKTTIPILTPSLADRKTLKIRLQNGLEAYLISDPLADKSAVALTVKTGSWEDYPEYPGIAHFLEHMLFLGTRKYPKESEFDYFISEHGGLTNAFTENDFTGYMFSVDTTAFPETLDRFASFFKEPLFNPSGVGRELQAIDQEYAKNKDKDDIRELYVYKELGNPNHPNHAFNMGNSLTLAKVSREVLQKWYQEHYSANLMRLIVISPLSLKKLKELVIEDFSNVPTTHRAPLEMKMSTLSPEIKGHIVYIEPVKDIRTLTLIWELPPKFADMMSSKPYNVVCQILGYEDKGSLLAYLKREGLGETLTCSSVKIGPNTMAFSIAVELTDFGVQHLNRVLEGIFQAISFFQQNEVPKYLFDEQQRTQQLTYQYQIRKDAFDTMFEYAIILPHEDIASFPELSNTLQKFDPEAINELFRYLTPQNAFIDLLAPSELTGIKPEKQERWVGASYAVRKIPQETMESWLKATPDSQTAFPLTNPFVPTKLELIQQAILDNPEKSLLPRPSLIVNNDFGKVYYAPDQRYLVPQLSLSFELITPEIVEGNAQKGVLADLFIKLITESLKEYTYLASIAGLDYEIKRSLKGLEITIDGYNEKALLLLNKIIDSMKNEVIDEQKFLLYKEILQRQYQNAQFESPVEQAFEGLKNILYRSYTTKEEKYQAIGSITLNQFNEFRKNIFSKIYYEGVIFGNLTEKQAQEITNIIFSLNESQPYPLADQPKTEVALLPQKSPFLVEIPSKALGNAVLLSIQDEPFTFKKRAAQEILMQGMKEPFFTTLRTKQQTGYLIDSAAEIAEKHLFDIFAVQSGTHDGRDLLARFELFIESFMQEITTEMSKSRYDNIHQSLLLELQQPPKNMKEMGSTLREIAFKYDGDFNWLDKRIQGFQDLTYDEFLTYAADVMGKQNRRRLGIWVKGTMPEEKVLQYDTVDRPNEWKKTLHYE